MVDRTQEVHQHSLASYEAALQQEYAAYQQARLDDDVAEMSRAATSIAGLRAGLKELNQMATEIYQQQFAAAQAQTNRWGLSASEQEVARNSFSNDRMSDDDKDRLYAANKQRYQYMRQTGQYRDDQGTVKR